MAMSDRQYSEKRDFMRMQIDSTAQVIRSSGESLSVRCSNLSSSGVLLESPQALPAGEQLIITIPSERPEFPDFCAEARVVRSSEVVDDLCRIALSIERIK
ncbi:PilZ domain-containing protein [Aestuariirhabdus litorea]|uniref:PilZ domain-containing protein n=1 Tax=Aestuariirhabdus litorea TaxID=2528527 RepID=A0A3P3VS88_9GAMM|nr:PilZ domain-containing protein [Aestuariirhabdus litorea]RRJ84838.1 PilZ domain-containing protein [Aestuariirhabdus litorea]RWW98063.1 PilZ domain-containing protein [Endozoicomonadaceae bacterium GTF-13]